MLITCHEGYCCEDHSSHVPTTCPRFFVKVCERCADGFRDFKASRRWCKRIVLTQFQDTMIISTFVCSIQPINTKMKIEQTLSGDPSLLYRLILQLLLLFLQSQQHQFFAPRHLQTLFIIITKLIQNYPNFQVAQIPILKMIFFSKSKHTIISQLKEMSTQLSKLSTHLSLLKLNDIFLKLFPSSGIKSSLNQLYQSSCQNEKQSYKSLRQIIRLLMPQSQIGQAIIHNRDSKYNLDKLNLQFQLQKYINSKDISLLLNIKKQINITSIPLFQAFIIHLYTIVLNQKDIDIPLFHQKNIENKFNHDDFYYYMVRNPMVYILRQWIKYTRNRVYLFDRLYNILESLFYKYPIYAIKNVDGYSIRPALLYIVYLMFEYRLNQLSWSFLSMLSQYLQYRHKNFNVLFMIWLKLHLSILQRNSQSEIQYRKALSLALQQQKMTSQLFKEDKSHELIYDNDEEYLNKLSLVLVRILQKQLWTINLKFAAQIKIIILLYKNMNVQHYLSEVFMIKIIDKIIKNYKEQQIRKFIKKIFYEELQLNKSQYYQKNLQHYNNYNNQVEVEGRRLFNSDRRQIGQTFGQSRRSMRSKIRQISLWQKPLQQGQNIYLFKLSRYLSYKIDKMRKIQSQSNNPSTNLRILSSYKVISIIILVIMVIFNYFK